jgi:sulfate permease, SulP family
MPDNSMLAATTGSRRGLLRGQAGLAAAVLPRTLLRVGRANAARETVTGQRSVAREPMSEGPTRSKLPGAVAGERMIASAMPMLLGGLLVGCVAVMHAVSYAAIVYSAEMAPHLSQGIGLTLVGTTVTTAVGALSLSYRGTITSPPGVTSVILSLAVAGIAGSWSGPPDALFPTVAALVAATTVLTGLATYLFGRFGLGFVARFIPYPVLGGFLAATGYLLVVGAIGLAVGEGVSIRNAAVLFAPGNPERWLPWILVGLAFAAVANRLRHPLVLPLCILAVAAGFYLQLWLRGIGIETARTQGLLLGPFDADGFIAGLDPRIILAGADWGVVLAQVPTIATVTGMTILGTLLSASAIGLATGTEVDSDRDLRGVGIANMLAGAGGGLVGYHLTSLTFLARSVGLVGSMAGLIVAAVSAAAIAFGAGFLGLLPIGVFASIVASLGFNLLYTWLWVERRRLPWRDFAIVLVIVVVAATIGFLEAIALGILAASLLFMIAYARTDVVRLQTTATSLRSRVERAEPALRRLARHGDRAVICRLTGYLFFGTASRLLAQLMEAVTAQAEGPAFALIDFRRVEGIDASAAFALGKLARSCATNQVELILSGLSARLLETLRRSGLAPGTGGVRVVDRLDDALQIVEERLLAETAAEDGDRPPAGILDELVRLHPDLDPARRFEELVAEPGDIVIAEGVDSDSVIVLLAGSLRAEVTGRDGEPTRIARILPGTLVGEIGHYAGVPRTATIRAEQRCRMLRIDRGALERLARENPSLAADFHRLAASDLARRLMRTTSLLRDADI